MPKRAYAKQCTFIRGIVSTQKNKIKECLPSKAKAVRWHVLSKGM